LFLFLLKWLLRVAGGLAAVFLVLYAGDLTVYHLRIAAIEGHRQPVCDDSAERAQVGI